MDPLSKPVEPQQPAPVVSPTPTPPAAPVQPAQRPPQNTQITDQFARPVAPWPPAGQVPAQETVNAVPVPVTPTPQPEVNTISPQVAQTIGLETSEAAGAIPNLGDQQVAKPVAQVIAEDSPLGPTPPVAATEEPMTDNQAGNLFKEEDSTKKRNKKAKTKKILKIVIGLLVTLIVLAGAYIFWFGNKAAQSYKNSSSISAYQTAFSDISGSLEKDPVESAPLEAGLNKLKIAEDNNTQLSVVVLGTVNPNYKKAKTLSGLVDNYKASTKSYKDKYSYPAFLASLANTNSVVNSLGDLDKIDVKVVHAEDVLKSVQTISDKCTKATAGIKDSPKPADMSTPTDTYYKALSEICSSLEPTIEVVLKDKTGIMTPEDQTKVKDALAGVSNSANSFTNGSGSASFYINQLSSYLRSAHDEAQKLQQSAEAILKA